MKKSRIAAIAVAAALSMGAVSTPTETGGIGITVSAASTLSAPKNISLTCSKGTLSVKWSNVPGATAYKVSVLYPGESKYKTLKTVYTESVKIPHLINGETVSVKITPLKKSGTGFVEGRSTTFSKLIKCEKAYMDGKVFIFDTTLLGKSSSQVEKALGKKIKLEDWQWWTDAEGRPLKVAFVKTGGCDISMTFNKEKKLIEVWADLSLDEYNDSLIEGIEAYYGERWDLIEYNNDPNETHIIYDRYCLYDKDIFLDVFDEKYGASEDTVIRQYYFLHEEILGE